MLFAMRDNYRHKCCESLGRRVRARQASILVKFVRSLVHDRELALHRVWRILGESVSLCLGPDSPVLQGVSPNGNHPQWISPTYAAAAQTCWPGYA